MPCIIHSVDHLCVFLLDCRFSAAYEKISTTANTMMEEHNALLEEVNEI